MMLPATKLPGDLQVLRIWEPMHARDGRNPIAYVSERRRRLLGGSLMAVGLVELAGGIVLGGQLLALLMGLGTSAAGGAYANGGRAGFYELDEDGSLGAYLGRAKPNLDSMRGRRP